MNYTHLLPFMEKDELKKIAHEIIDGKIEGVKLETLFPFLGREAMSEIVDLLIEKKDSSRLKKAVPFVSKEKIETIFQAAESGEISNFDPTLCLPFLGTDKIRVIFDQMIKKAASEPIDEDSDEDLEDLDELDED
ncbi:MAG: hypothetical protein JXR38_01590 [Bacilli bacterium]|nr:hypothetical protein [Bacilli bacterium]